MQDQQLIRKIKTLHNITPRSEWVALNRDFLMRQIGATEPAQAINVSWQEYSRFVFDLVSQRVFQPAVAMMMLLLVSLSSTLIANAAFYSLPGDSLYSVKIALEKTQLAVTANDTRKAELKVAFAHNRVQEFNKIVAQTDVDPTVKKERLNLVVKEFEKNVASVQNHINKIAQASGALAETDKQKSLQIALTISSETQELVSTLGQNTSNLSEVEKKEVETIVAKAVESAQQASLSAQELIDAALNGDQATSTETVLGAAVTDGAAGTVETSTPAITNPLLLEPGSQGEVTTQSVTEQPADPAATVEPN